jgi:hypothetical protein
VLGISIGTLRNKLNEYAADGPPGPPGGGEPRAAASRLRQCLDDHRLDLAGAATAESRRPVVFV